MPPVSEPSLIEIHRRMDQVFELTRELLVSGDGAHAGRALATYRALTASHAAAEEALLVPCLPDAARWPASLYLGQHVKLLAGIDRAVDVVAAVAAPAPRWRIMALCALDALIPVMHLVEHHHAAEELELFPHVPPAIAAEVAAVGARDLEAHAEVLAACQVALRARS